MSFGRNIRTRRRLLGMTQAELAQKAGLYDGSSISKIENGQSDATASVLMRIADALGCTAGQLLTVGSDVMMETVSERQLRKNAGEMSPPEASLGRFMTEMKEAAEMYRQGLFTAEEFAAVKKYIMALTLENENE